MMMYSEADKKLMSLGEKQRLFPRMLHELDKFMWDNGYEYTLGDAFRDPRVHGAVGVKMGYGNANSGHKNKLAEDRNLFKKIDGKWVYLDKTEDHKACGEFWESLGGSWGGRFNDGNHYSLEHNGVK